MQFKFALHPVFLFSIDIVDHATAGLQSHIKTLGKLSTGKLTGAAAFGFRQNICTMQAESGRIGYIRMTEAYIIIALKRFLMVIKKF